jgi:hypothetical protein
VSVGVGILLRLTPLITLLGFCGCAPGIPLFASGVVRLPVSGFCSSVLLPTALFAGEIWLPERVALLKLPVLVLVKMPLVPVLSELVLPVESEPALPLESELD